MKRGEICGACVFVCVWMVRVGALGKVDKIKCLDVIRVAKVICIVRAGGMWATGDYDVGGCAHI